MMFGEQSNASAITRALVLISLLFISCNCNSIRSSSRPSLGRGCKRGRFYMMIGGGWCFSFLRLREPVIIGVAVSSFTTTDGFICAVSSHMTMHVAVCSESHQTNSTFERPFPRMNKHMAIERTSRTQSFTTYAACMRVISWIVLPNMLRERMLRLKNSVANGTCPFSSLFILRALKNDSID